jgi:hypothetical protein
MPGRRSKDVAAEKRFFPWNGRVAATLFLLAVLTSALAIAADVLAIRPPPGGNTGQTPSTTTHPQDKTLQ